MCDDLRRLLAAFNTLEEASSTLTSREEKRCFMACGGLCRRREVG